MLSAGDPAASSESPTPSEATPGGPAARRSALRRRLVGAGLDALLVTDLVNVRYLTGFTGSNAALLVAATDTGTRAGADGEPGTLLCTDGRYDTQSAAEVPDLPRLIERPCDLALIARSAGRVGFEAHVLTVAGRQSLGRAAASATAEIELHATTDLVESCRLIKEPTEVEALARACAVADRAFAELLASGVVAPGRTEREIGLDLDQRMRLLGASAPAFDTIVATGANGAIPHHRPDDTAVRSGELVTFDFGAVVDGYHSDMTRTVAVGPPADWQRELYRLVADAQRAGSRAAVPGASGDAVDAAARAVIEGSGHGEHFVHGLGHGVGLQVHEGPAVARRSAAIMKPGMCVTIEPGVYLPGRGGVRIEDSGVIRPDGYQVLTTTTKELLVL